MMARMISSLVQMIGIQTHVVYGQSVSQCPMKMYLSGNGTCKNCTLGNGCLNCSGKTGECTSCPSGKVVSGTGCVDGTVVVIEVNSNKTITEEDIANEIKKIMGVDVTVIEVNKGTFEVTLTDITKANQLISTIDVCRKTLKKSTKIRNNRKAIPYRPIG